MADFEITSAHATDIPLIRNLAYKIWPQVYTSILSPAQIEYMLQLMYNEQTLNEQMANESHFLILRNPIEPIGFCAYYKETDRVFKLDKIYVLPEKQGRGGGSFLLSFVINEIIHQGAEYLKLNVNRNNMAVGFYKKMGFYITGTEDNDIGEGYFMNDFIMQKQLST